jgi:hypothetical protein
MGHGDRRWYVEIVQLPGTTEARFGYVSQQLGHQVWDCLVWPLDIGEWTERAILAELYDAVLAFMEPRA